MVSTFAGGEQNGSSDGTNTTAQFDTPIGIAFDKNYNLFVVDTYNHRIRKITSKGTK
jgi:serine/threonine protein kinase, bacterial